MGRDISCIHTGSFGNEWILLCLNFKKKIKMEAGR
jgi:hypothetical protein